jgi:hypothetical protein
LLFTAWLLPALEALLLAEEVEAPVEALAFPPWEMELLELEALAEDLEFEIEGVLVMTVGLEFDDEFDPDTDPDEEIEVEGVMVVTVGLAVEFDPEIEPDAAPLTDVLSSANAIDGLISTALSTRPVQNRRMIIKPPLWAFGRRLRRAGSSPETSKSGRPYGTLWLLDEPAPAMEPPLWLV